MEQQQQDLAGLIKKAGSSQRVIEFECPFIRDFFVSIAYASKFILNQIREGARVMRSNFRTRDKEERFDDDKIRKGYCQHIIQKWRGLTGRKLQAIIPGLSVQPEDLDKEIIFSSDVAMAILEVSLEMENWVLDVATNVDNYSNIAEEKRTELENLK